MLERELATTGGAIKGFLLDTSNDAFCIGYYGARDIPFYSALAQSYTAYDNRHAAILGPTFPNRMFIWAAQTDRLTDSVAFTSLPTIFDSLSAAGISHRYYFNNVPYLALWGFKYIFSMGLYSDFLNDAASGNLPAVSFVDPNCTVLDDGTGNDDHPNADIRNGDAFLSHLFQAVANGPNPGPVFGPPCFEGGIFSDSTTRSPQTAIGTRANEWTALADSLAVKQVLSHTHIQSRPQH